MAKGQKGKGWKSGGEEREEAAEGKDVINSGNNSTSTSPSSDSDIYSVCV